MKYKWIAQDYDGLIVRHVYEPELSSSGKFWEGRGWDIVQDCRRESGPLVLINLETHDYKIEDGILMKVEKEQIFKGSELQCKHINGGGWVDCSHDLQYRPKLKTKVVRFRNYLTSDETVEVTEMVSPDNFRKWLGDWQEVEVPDE